MTPKTRSARTVDRMRNALSEEVSDAAMFYICEAIRAAENQALEHAAAALEAEAVPGDEDEELSVSGMREMHCRTIRALKHPDHG